MHFIPQEETSSDGGTLARSSLEPAFPPRFGRLSLNPRSSTKILRATARLVGEVSLFLVAFFLAYRFGMSFGHASASPFWFPDSVLLCALLLNRPRRWWIFVLAPLPIRLFAEVAHGIPLWFLLTTFAIDSAKGLVAASLLHRFLELPARIATRREVALYGMVAVLLVPGVAAFGGAAARHALAPGYDYWASWEQWFLGNALTHMVITPAILHWVFGAPRLLPIRSARRWIEGSLLTSGLLFACWLAFGTEWGEPGLGGLLSFAPAPFLFWAALRFGMTGASFAVLVLAGFSVSAALHGVGPFSGGTPAETARHLQEFLGVRALAVYLVALLVHQMKDIALELEESERRFHHLAKEADRETQRLGLKLAHVNRVTTMGGLTAAVAHELRQPLGAILSNAEAAGRILDANPSALAEVREILGDICAENQRAGEIIRGMRSLLEKHEIVRGPVEINGMLEESFRLVRIEAAERNIAMKLETLREPRHVAGDRVHLQQVLMNLILNSFEAMAAVPEIGRALTVNVRGDDATVEIAVCDTGPGIPDEYLPRLFESFWTTKKDGLGIGLSITQRIVEAHEGRVWAENNPGPGATFRVSLPRLAEGPM